MFTQVKWVSHNLRLLACKLVEQDFMEVAILLRVAAQQIECPVVSDNTVEQVQAYLLKAVSELNMYSLTDLADFLQSQIGALFNGDAEFTEYENLLFPGLQTKRILT